MGNKRVTKTDFENYDESLKKGYSRRKIGVTPNAAAQNMLRLSGPDAGEISSNMFTGNLPTDGKGNFPQFDPGGFRAEKKKNYRNSKGWINLPPSSIQPTIICWKRTATNSRTSITLSP